LNGKLVILDSELTLNDGEEPMEQEEDDLEPCEYNRISMSHTGDYFVQERNSTTNFV
jgi:hypothetical protein